LDADIRRFTGLIKKNFRKSFLRGSAEICILIKCKERIVDGPDISDRQVEAEAQIRGARLSPLPGLRTAAGLLPEV
jgi:hypothetical protein